MAAEAEADAEADAVAPQLVGPQELRILKSNLERRQKYKKSQSASFGKPPTRRTAAVTQAKGGGVARGGVGAGGEGYCPSGERQLMTASNSSRKRRQKRRINCKTL